MRANEFIVETREELLSVFLLKYPSLNPTELLSIINTYCEIEDKYERSEKLHDIFIDITKLLRELELWTEFRQTDPDAEELLTDYTKLMYVAQEKYKKYGRIT